MTAFSKVISLDDMPLPGFDWRIEADEAARKAIAERLQIPEVTRLAGELHVMRNSDGIDLSGRLGATLQRLCVASLEPMEETVSEAFEIRFSTDAEPGGDIDVDAPEPFPEEGLDLAEILVQQLALAMAPYPHKEGVRPLAEDYGGSGHVSPFDALKGAFAARRDKE